LITAIGGAWVIYNTTDDVTLPTIESFGVNPEQIVPGESSTLSWSVSDAADVTVTPGTRSLPLSGSMKVHPTQTTTYILKASNKHGSTKATTVVSVETNNVQANVPVIIYFQASPEKIFSGENTILNWSVSGATSVKITPDIGNVPLNGFRMVNPTKVLLIS
jgi:hypothetical protein